MENNKTDKQKAIFALLVLITVFAIAILADHILFPKEGFNEKVKDEVVVVIAEYINLRAEPNTESEILDVLYKGEELTKTGYWKDSQPGIDLRWFEVITESGLKGWVRSGGIN